MIQRERAFGGLKPLASTEGIKGRYTIEQISFHKGFGYKCVDVDRYVDRSQNELRALQADKAALVQQVEDAEEKTQELRQALQEIYSELLMLREAEFERARRLTDILETAHTTAEQITRESRQDALQKAEEMVRQAEEKAAQIEQQTLEHVRQTKARIATEEKVAAAVILSAGQKAADLLTQAWDEIRKMQSRSLCEQPDNMWNDTVEQEVSPNSEASPVQAQQYYR